MYAESYGAISSKQLLGQASGLKGFLNFFRPESEYFHADQLSIAELVGKETLRLDATLTSGHLPRKQG